MTMSVCSIGMVSKMFTECIEGLDKRILESLDAAGCNTFQKIRYGILPQLFPDFMSTIIYRFDRICGTPRCWAWWAQAVSARPRSSP